MLGRGKRCMAAALLRVGVAKCGRQCSDCGLGVRVNCNVHPIILKEFMVELLMVRVLNTINNSIINIIY